MTDIEARRMLGRNWYTVTSQVIEEICYPRATYLSITVGLYYAEHHL